MSILPFRREPKDPAKERAQEITEEFENTILAHIKAAQGRVALLHQDVRSLYPNNTFALPTNEIIFKRIYNDILPHVQGAARTTDLASALTPEQRTYFMVNPDMYKKLTPLLKAYEGKYSIVVNVLRLAAGDNPQTIKDGHAQPYNRSRADVLDDLTHALQFLAQLEAVEKQLRQIEVAVAGDSGIPELQRTGTH